MKKKFIIFIVGLAALLLFQYKVVVPFVYKIVASDLFLEESGDDINRSSSDNIMTNAAFEKCNDHIANEILDDYSIIFPKKPLNAFSLGNYQYVVNADIEIQPANAAVFNRRYACRTKYLNGSDNTTLSDINNWSFVGISGLDDI